MKIVIAGGTHEADYIVGMFKKEKHKMIVINNNPHFSQYISSTNHIEVFDGDPSKDYVLSDAGVDQADVLIALSSKDIDNYVICMLAKKLFQVKKCICTVTNPKNVDLFKQLGIETVISSTYHLAQMIKNESALENVIKTLSMEDEKIVITEITIEQQYQLTHQKIANIHFPAQMNIGCIFRDPHVIIPNGNTIILPNDKLVILSTPEQQQKITEFIQKSTV